MFATLFLGTILAVFLTLGAVRGHDAERGLLQPVLVRPVQRRTVLAEAVRRRRERLRPLRDRGLPRRHVRPWAFNDEWPDGTVAPALMLAAAVAVLSALSLAGSVLLSANANGIAVFMLFSAGLTAGLLGQIGEALGSRTLDRVADVVSWVLPFEALYQAALAAITADTVGFTRLAINLGPFGGAEEAGPCCGRGRSSTSRWWASALRPPSRAATSEAWNGGLLSHAGAVILALMLKVIAVGTDGSATADKALEFAIDLAVRHNAKLVVLSAYSNSPSAWVSGVMAAGWMDPGPNRASVEPAGGRARRAAARSCRASGAEARRRSAALPRARGSAETLVELAERHEADVLVIGNRGMRRRVLGGEKRAGHDHAHKARCSGVRREDDLL